MSTPAKPNKTILVAGGAGYIGTHTVVELQQRGYHVVVVDNLVNSSERSLAVVQEITGQEVEFHRIDLATEPDKLEALLESRQFDACIHFAGLKAVGESVQKPLEYYMNNLNSTFHLLRLLDKHKCHNFIFSSSATVYGDPETVPIREDAPIGSGITNPYGRTKYFIEEILKDFCLANPHFRVVLLRYFNPCGAHISGLLGEDPHGIPNNLMPYIQQVAVGRRSHLTVFGSDYPTPDGTGVRDYIHVVDLARGHVAALERGCDGSKQGVTVYNLGAGQGYSVLDMVKAFGKAAGKDIAYQLGARRPGDIATCFADPSKAKNELGWECELGLERICEDSWRWQSTHPYGFKTREEAEAQE